MAQTVFVGLSGGVDSAVSATLLKSQGHNVVGVFIKIWQAEFLECTWKEDRLDAMRVAAALEIPFREVDLSEEYKKEVVEKMVADYARGITPNPDVLCNRAIKFGAFAAWAKSEGADMLATGHYVQIKERDNRFELLRAKDAAKDQSYFLYRLDQSDLAHTLFPIGGMLKSEVRAEARRFHLPVADKPDSQGLCFVGEVSMADFLARFIALQRGPVVAGGTIVGEHDGAALYTIGQRHGFTAENAEGPYYLVRIDVPTNTLHVSVRREDAARTETIIEDVHWVYREPTLPLAVQVQARYHEQEFSATLSKNDPQFSVEFEHPHIASPGQSLVLYDGNTCLGGGTIS
ncbi:MAG: tRNA 2-thiouridine(34) synthase MnmA [bacterium]|nr:tRNA 2-thiouridine(34) synthase MnmA [bacterium]